MRKAIGKRIRDIRKKQGLTQETVASILNISTQKMSRIESGKNDITFTMITQLADVFNVSPNDITDISNPSEHKDSHASGNLPPSMSPVSHLIDMFFAQMSLYERITSAYQPHSTDPEDISNSEVSSETSERQRFKKLYKKALAYAEFHRAMKRMINPDDEVDFDGLVVDYLLLNGTCVNADVFTSKKQ